jgi:XTP/dITP diphosphohydrolase
MNLIFKNKINESSVQKPKEMKIVIASTNRHKIEEIQRILDIDGLSFTSLQDYRSIRPALENGNTFLENAIIKAKYYHRHVKQQVIADDSGLIVPALAGQPGIHSARYAG